MFIEAMTALEGPHDMSVRLIEERQLRDAEIIEARALALASAAYAKAAAIADRAGYSAATASAAADVADAVLHSQLCEIILAKWPAGK